MGKTFHIGTWFGIPLKIHWSFLFIIAYIAGTILQQGSSYIHGMWFTLFIFSIFTSVILHEYGHALAAKRYNINTKDIIIMPIGGVARLEDLPSKPLQEIIIAIAGPLVNILIVLVLLITYQFTKIGELELYTYDITAIAGLEEFLIYVIGVNLMLFLFNLIPAFPMDGGRVLRALLAIKLGRLKATKIASTVGQAASILFAIYGAMNGQLGLLFIGIYIFLAARSELGSVVMSSKFDEVSASDIMLKNYTQFHIGDSLEEAWTTIHMTSESDYLIVDSMGYPAGWIPKPYLEELKTKPETYSPSTKLMQVMGQKIISVLSKDPLSKVIGIMQKESVPLVIVKDQDQTVGIINRQLVYDKMK